MKCFIALTILAASSLMIPLRAGADDLKPGLPQDNAMNAVCAKTIRATSSRHEAEKNARAAWDSNRLLEAYCWHKNASDLGSLSAREQVGTDYLMGGTVKQNVDLGFQYVLSAAEAGSPSAQYQVIGMYEGHSLTGNRPDAELARHWCGVMTSNRRGRKYLKGKGASLCSESDSRL